MKVKNKVKFFRSLVLFVLLIVAIFVAANIIRDSNKAANATQQAINKQVTKLKSNPDVIDVKTEAGYYVSVEKNGSKKLLVFSIDDTLAKLQKISPKEGALSLVSKHWIGEHPQYMVLNTLHSSLNSVVYEIK